MEYVSFYHETYIKLFLGIDALHSSVPMTIPKLELFAALILARLVATAREGLSQVINFESVFCWTDSVTVFYWIQANKDYKQFVQNRVDEIHKLTDLKSWRHCPGVENPGDFGCRGCPASELVSNSLWWEGPAWLRGFSKHYPKSGVSSEEDLSEECNKEVKPMKRNPEIVTNTSSLVSLTKEPTPNKPVTFTDDIECERFSDIMSYSE